MQRSSAPPPPHVPDPTPALRQYLDAKRRHQDAIVFFRMGDFYEMFYEDALVASRALDLVLTSRTRDGDGGAIPMCGVPFHAADSYVARLVKKGFKVAICEQLEDAKQARGLVRRDVVRVITPGTFADPSYLDAREHSFLMAIASVGEAVGLAALDVTTGDFWAAEYTGADARRRLLDEIQVLAPKEVLVSDAADLEALGLAARRAPGPATASDEVAGGGPASGEGIPGDLPVSPLDGWAFDVPTARRALLEQLHTQSLQAFDCDGRPAVIAAAGALVHYLKETQKADLSHVRSLRFRREADSMVLDSITVRHLELVESLEERTRRGSLVGHLDLTATAMGSRLLRSWLLRPLLAVEAIQERLDAVENFAFRVVERGRFRDALKHVQDLERLIGRVALGTAGPRDLVGLRQSLGAIPRLLTAIEPLEAPLVRSLATRVDPLSDIRERIDRTLVDNPPALARDGGMIRDGVDPELDELRGISRSGKRFIAALEDQERRRTGIQSLKVRFNKVFGYYIEVSKPNLASVPGDYQRKQTIAGGERFITPELKEYETKVLGADERILELETALFADLRGWVAAQATRIQDTARSIATLDVLAALAEAACLYNYVKPHVHAGDELAILEGRHPVVERTTTDPFVPNDLLLDRAARRVLIITGPNMGGKSTYLRQCALISLLAQIGSFVPAREAKLPLIDRVFTRVGASDNLVRGQSTFLVEMQETANILHAATDRSLVLLDEIGRGTATFDGLSLAWAVAEHLALSPAARPRTLFATHYHELTDLAAIAPGVVNVHVSAREWNDRIIFLRKVVEGRSDRSYGIQVARLAGMPPEVIARALEILATLERDELDREGRPKLSAGGPPSSDGRQLQLFANYDDRVLERIRGLSIDSLTPIDALNLLAAFKKDLDRS